MKERFKQWKDEHKETIVFVSSMALCVSTGVLTSVIMNKKVDVLRVTQNQNDLNEVKVILTNGNKSYWTMPAPKA
jgi:hypothetical protein